MLTSRFRAFPGRSAPLFAIATGDVLPSGCGMTAASIARCRPNNNRGPAKGPLIAASRIHRGAASGRIYEAPLNQEHTA